MMYTEYVELCKLVGNRLGSVLMVGGTTSPYPAQEELAIRNTTDPMIKHGGVLLQRCGGGHRVLRKKLGQN